MPVCLGSCVVTWPGQPAAHGQIPQLHPVDALGAGVKPESTAALTSRRGCSPTTNATKRA